MQSSITSYKIMAAALSAIFLLITDRFLKQWALENLAKPMMVINNWLALELCQNKNIAFSLPLPEFIIMPLIIAVIVVLMLYFLVAIKFQFGWQEVALLLIITGALGNLFDRLQYGFVVDYVSFSVWPVFNLADMMISAGVVFILVAILRSKK